MKSKLTGQEYPTKKDMELETKIGIERMKKPESSLVKDLPWPSVLERFQLGVIIDEIPRMSGFFERVLVPKEHTIALMELCSNAAHQYNTAEDWISIQAMAEKLWREIFEVNRD